MHTTTDDDPFGWPSDEADPLDALLTPGQHDEGRRRWSPQDRLDALDAWHDVMTERQAAASEPRDWPSW